MTTDIDKTQSALSVDQQQASSAVRIEQPYELQPNNIWYFQTFISHSGAVGVQHIPKAEVERRLAAQAGPGQLVQIEGVWHWKPNCDYPEYISGNKPKNQKV